jgi:hypothetical protein
MIELTSTHNESGHMSLQYRFDKIHEPIRFIVYWVLLLALYLSQLLKSVVQNILQNIRKLVAFTKRICYVTIQYLLTNTFKEATCQEPANARNEIIHVKTIDRHLGQVNLDKIAYDSKFYQRAPQKITAFAFVKSLCNAAYQQIFSYSKVAFLLGLLGADISKQAVAERINRHGVVFLRQVLNVVISNVSGLCSTRNAGVFETFGNVFVQDSTNLPLPQHFADAYPGAKNHTNKINACMKIQAIFNIVNERLANLNLSPFTRTDQAASKDILPLVKTGDLVIRDLGYFVLSVFEKFIQKGVFFLSRYRNNVTIYCPKSGNKLNLLNILKKKSSLDIDVLLGSTHKLPVRLVALPVPDHIANERRRKAKNNRDRRCNPSKESLQLLGWEIFVTNVGRSIWDPLMFWEIYAIRWRIEIIFKAWKSHLSLDKIPQNVNRHELEVYIYAHLLNIIFFHVFFDQLNQFMIRKYNKYISVLKIAPLFDQIINSIFLFGDTISSKQIEHFLEKLILRHCCYEKRKKRLNYSEQLARLGCLA